MALCILASCAAVLAVAAWLTPDPSGLGSHRQLGGPACTWVMLFGYPCPTCGMTTAFAHTVRGQFLSAFAAQPAGLALALLAMAAVGVSLSVLATGRVWAVNWFRVPPASVPLVILAVVLAGWVYKLVAGMVAGAWPVPL